MSTTTDLSIDELKALIEQKKAAAKKEKASKRSKYENKRERLLNTLGAEAFDLHSLMVIFKSKSLTELLAFREEMIAYGELRGGDYNKGSFSIKNEKFKIEVSTQIIKSFDERAELAASKLKEFLKTAVKKSGRAMFELISAATQRNEKTGSFDPDVVNRLYKIEDRFDDPNWLEAIALFKESYTATGSALYVRYSRMMSNGQWESIVLDFARLKTGKEVAND